MSRGSYLYQLRKAPSKSLDNVYSEQLAAIRKIHADSKERYGYRRVMYVLRNQGTPLNHKTVHKLMQHLNLQELILKLIRNTTPAKELSERFAPINILNREFNPPKPCDSFATDISEFYLLMVNLSLSAIIDMCSNEIVAYDISRILTLDK